MSFQAPTVKGNSFTKNQKDNFVGKANISNDQELVRSEPKWQNPTLKPWEGKAKLIQFYRAHAYDFYSELVHLTYMYICAVRISRLSLRINICSLLMFLQIKLTNWSSLNYVKTALIPIASCLYPSVTCRVNSVIRDIRSLN